jgi:hypothetical protein
LRPWQGTAQLTQIKNVDEDLRLVHARSGSSGPSVQEAALGRMLTVALGAAAVAGAMAFSTSAAKAQDTPAPDPRLLCPWMVSMGYFRTQGDCMSGYRMGGAAFCMRLPPEMLSWYGYRNQGECVARMRELDRR